MDRACYTEVYGSWKLVAPGGPAVCPRGPGALPPLSLLSPSPGAAALRILAPGREGQDFIPQGRERPSRMPQMAFPSTLCLWDLQENEVRPGSLGRQGRPDPKEAQARRSCGPSRTPGPVLGDGETDQEGAGRRREVGERQGGRAAGDRAAPVTACVPRGSRLPNQSRVLGPQQPVVTQGRIPSLKSPAAHLFRQERAL